MRTQFSFIVYEHENDLYLDKISEVPSLDFFNSRTMKC